MNAAEFYQHFEAALKASGLPPELKRAAGAVSKWKLATPVGGVQLAWATNPKAAGLWPMMPGEFRLKIEWTAPAQKKAQAVDVHQYTTADEKARWAQLQRQAQEKFLAQDGKEGLRAIFAYAADPATLPRANFEEWCHYCDADDARAWGEWFGAVTGPWLARFIAAPESHEDWCWRVLWPHLERAKPAGA
ncbi:MAG: hypothetical protein ACREVL_05215 [Solimonas sp.]